MPLPWKVLFLLALLGVVWLGFRDVSRCNSEYVSYSVLSNEFANIRAVLLPLRNGSERLKSDFVNFTNRVHGLGVKRIGKVRNNLASNNGVLPNNDLKSMQEASNPVNQDRYIRGDYQFTQAGDLKYLTFDGCDFRVGCPSEFGRVVVIDKFFTICIDNYGKTTYLLPKIDNNGPRALYPPRGSLQAVGGTGTRGPWYCTHTGTE